MTTLVLADVNKGKLGDAVARAVTAASQLGAPIHLLVATQGAQEAAAEATKLAGVEKVLVADDATYAHQLAEPMAALIVSLAKNYGAIVSTATTTAKNIMPRVAALLDVMQLSEIIKVVAPDTFERPIYAGNAIQTVQSTDALKVITVRTTAFAPAAATGSAAVEAIGAGDKPDLSSFKGEALAKSDRPELTAARIIISGGRAMQNPENFKLLIEPVADKLGAAMGASRAAVDAGYAPNDWQVARPARSLRPSFTLPSVFLEPSSISPA